MLPAGYILWEMDTICYHNLAQTHMLCDVMALLAAETDMSHLSDQGTASFSLRMRQTAYPGTTCNINALVSYSTVDRLNKTNDSHMSSSFLHLW